MLNDYKGLKLIASSNPHIRNNEDTRSIMLDVVIALCPALLMSVIRFGFRALIAVVVSMASAMFFEWLYRKLLHKTQTVGDLSAAVTGMLLAFVSPVTLPYWMLIVGNFFAIFVVKQLYGGLGKNFLNPALAGRAALVACYTSQMTSWIDPASGKAPLFGGADVVTAATPLAMMKGGEFAEVTAQYSLSDMFIGNIGGSLGEISAMMLLIGGLYLIFRKVISWQIPVAYIGTVAVLTFLFPQGNDAMSWMLYDVLGDVVCGGFAAPIREGYAEDVLIVTSGEKMALYAANNIATAVENFADRGYAKVRGVLLNRRNVPREEEKVQEFARAHQLPILADIPRSDAISEAEERGMTVVEYAPDAPVSQAFFALANDILKE